MAGHSFHSNINRVHQPDRIAIAQYDREEPKWKRNKRTNERTRSYVIYMAARLAVEWGVHSIGSGSSLVARGRVSTAARASDERRCYTITIITTHDTHIHACARPAYWSIRHTCHTQRGINIKIIIGVLNAPWHTGTYWNYNMLHTHTHIITTIVANSSAFLCPIFMVRVKTIVIIIAMLN